MDNATCVMCNRGVHFEAGRIACDGCDLPTDCCLCAAVPRRPAPASTPASAPTPRAPGKES